MQDFVNLKKTTRKTALSEHFCIAGILNNLKRTLDATLLIPCT